ncbi:MAG: CPBP family intramembrane metalloprotease [Coriobacteriia bacterium]|nr:CPBP family intramembrane metalloprotease [Coriobacteriia bacterium]
MNYQQHPGFAPPPPPTPKKQLRRDIMVVVVVLLGIFAIQIVLVATATVGVVFTSPEFIGTMQEVANSSVYDQQEIIDNTDFEQMAANINYDFLMVAMLIAALLTLPMLMIIRGKRALTTDLVAVNQKARPLSIFKTLLLMLGIGAAANLLAMAVAPLLDLADLSLTDYMEDSISGMLTSPVGLLYVALLGPIIEEIIFRGAILNRLSRHGINFAIVTQALMFGLFHGILFQSFYAFFMGLILGYVAVRYSLKWAMVLHIANNSISVGFSLLDQAGIGPVVDYLMIAYLIVFFVGAVVLLIVKRKQFSVIRQHGLPVTPEPYRIAFSSPFLIIFIAIYLGMGVYTLFLPLFL